MNSESLPDPAGERHSLSAEEELRLEVPFGASSITTITLQNGSAEIWGVELALQKPMILDGGLQIAVFTWHGCVIDVDSPTLSSSYVSDETNSNVATVNTHAQLEALRDEAAGRKWRSAKGLPGRFQKCSKHRWSAIGGFGARGSAINA